MADQTTEALYAALECIREDTLHRSLLPPFRKYRKTAWFQNWAETFRCTPQAVFAPRDFDQCKSILELAKREGKRLRAMGARHSPSDLWCTNEWMIRMDRIDRLIVWDSPKNSIVAPAGMTLHTLHRKLGINGLAMRNVGSISDQSIAGVISTATHGTGWDFPVISGDVLSLTILLANGEIVTCSKEVQQDLFLASLCGLGATGLILSVELQLERSFKLQESRERLPFEIVLKSLDLFAPASEHTRIWWNPQADTAMLMLASRSSAPLSPAKSSWFWGTVVGHWYLEFLLWLSLAYPDLTGWIGRFASGLDAKKVVVVDQSWKIFNLDCLFRQYTTEWALPASQAQSALSALRALLATEAKKPHGLRPHFPIEIRWSDADEIWLSPSYGRKTCWVGIVQYKPYGIDVPWRGVFDAFESIMLSHGGRPHWAKLHPLTPEQLGEMYPRFADFKRLLERVDPEGIWRNEYVRRHVFGEWEGQGADVYSKRVPR
ncbi:gulonolactone oxidase Lgo1 [Dacryopinax primogenitus]|uniref:D-arabinono-1,4-lactone oxidase n=1 Tax=Dacryopinax primogenitus (strain DJM 731) TaxID=1858805 RepID=M5FPM9_DACPD|nr:gulonolactone oxidase Lgo1 [Dacryopinax primogenitus]EJT97178.1 gulonolactone oxidase Lgo1 [Dacryopinax primogenitus]